MAETALSLVTGVVDLVKRHVIKEFGQGERRISKAAVLPKSTSAKMQATALVVEAGAKKRKGKSGAAGTFSSNHASLGYPCILGHGTSAKRAGNRWPMPLGQGLRSDPVDDIPPG